MTPSIEERARHAGEETRQRVNPPPPPVTVDDFASRLGRRRRRQTGAGGAALVAMILAVVVVVSRPTSLPVISNDHPTPAPATESPTATATASPARIDRSMEELAPSPLAPRTNHSVVWTGQEMVVFGGQATDDPPSEVFDDGAAYDPATDSWRPLAGLEGEGISKHVAVWTGTRMLVVGGVGDETSTRAYDPEANRWSRLADVPFPVRTDFSGWAWVGSELAVWTPREGFATFDPTANAWTMRPAPPIDFESGNQQNTYPALRSHGDVLYALLGPARGTVEVAVRRPDVEWQRADDLGPQTVTHNGARYRLLPSPYLSVATSRGLLAFTESPDIAPSLLLDPQTAIWAELDPPGIPACEGFQAPVAIPDGAILFNYCGNAALFDAASASFTPLGLPTTGGSSVTVWTGDSLITVAAGCCFASSSGIVRMATWERTLDDARVSGLWTRADLVAETAGMVPGWFAPQDGPEDLFVQFWRPKDSPAHTRQQLLTQAVRYMTVAPAGMWTPLHADPEVLEVTLQNGTVTLDLDETSATTVGELDVAEAQLALEMVRRNIATLYPEADTLCITYDSIPTNPNDGGPGFLGPVAGCPLDLTTLE